MQQINTNRAHRSRIEFMKCGNDLRNIIYYIIITH